MISTGINIVCREKNRRIDALDSCSGYASAEEVGGGGASELDSRRRSKIALAGDVAVQLDIPLQDLV
jgi:hypothetical protein